MKLRKLGNSEVEVTPLAFGAWAIGGWLWGGAEEKSALRAIRASFDLGITTIDTAPAYGFGRSEILVGQAMEGIDRAKYQILTKYGLVWTSDRGDLHLDTVDNDGNPVKMYRNANPESVIRECEESLRRLNTDYIDLLQIHWPDSTTPIADTMGAVGRLIEQGKVRAAGLCNYNVQQVEEALKTLSVVSNQVPYSMVNRRIEKDIIPQALEKGLAILPYSPLQRGLLTGKIHEGYSFQEGDNRPQTKYFSAENIRRANELLDKIRPLADAHNATLSQVVINWTSRQPAISCVLVGARDEKQVAENAGALAFELSDTEMEYITSMVHETELVG
ncbi:MAG TPA: aldo/keto reductase [Cyclobacteriaceae bacterium]|nr:aldo/keto reductase [Cyclobacteriaceae bacterium]